VTPNYWAGSGLLPRAAQYKNVMIAIYNIETIPAMYVPIKYFYTHAWLPKDKFDEVWRKTDGSLRERGWVSGTALAESDVWGTYRIENGDPKGFKKPLGSDTEIISHGAQNIWLCQMGRNAEDGAFADFVENVSAAEVTFSGMNVEYLSPAVGTIRLVDRFLERGQCRSPLNDHRRYDNPIPKLI
jgi:hypothetical protein